MDEVNLNEEARRENVHALMVAAGISESEASHRLETAILITRDDSDRSSVRLSEEILPILGRTLKVYRDLTSSAVSAELVLGAAKPRTGGPYVYAILARDRLVISDTVISLESLLPSNGLMIVLSACYVSGAVIYCAVGKDMPNPPPGKFEIRFSDFLSYDLDPSNPVDIGEAYLAGAGAIGNGFLWACRYVPVRGRLHVVDDDVVSAGNLQRQIWFEEEDIGESKAVILCKRAQDFMPACTLLPNFSRLQKHPNKHDGSWLKRIVVAVDSRRARRALQEELPGEVFDASTTGSQEIVLHYNKQPTDLACLGCIYTRDQSEISHEQAIAEHLGIDPEDMQSERINVNSAKKICALHPQLKPQNIEGLAYETLYKQLCSSGQLKTPSGKQVIAPFAFVSVLAGILLLIDIIRTQTGTEVHNDWRVNPWHPPVPELKQIRSRNPDCEWCTKEYVQRFNDRLWHII